MSSPILKICAFFLILAGASLLVHFLDISEVLDPAFADAYLKHRGGVAIYIALVTLLSPLGFPRQALAALGGYAFGVLNGTGLTLAGLGLGCAAGFFYARLLARPALFRRFEDKIRPLDKFLSRNPFATTVAIRCLPIGNNALTNMIAGV
ncbi:MAG: VTT domain-containing protein, partial [Desulfovibrio sp.]|nr:VTT domain-containing protein [Desulfovibrio sp.]